MSEVLKLCPLDIQNIVAEKYGVRKKDVEILIYTYDDTDGSKKASFEVHVVQRGRYR